MLLNQVILSKLIKINDNWTFRYIYDYDRKNVVQVTLPHTFNVDALNPGTVNYQTTAGVYEYKMTFNKPYYENKSVYIKFEGSNQITIVHVNDKFVGIHRNGYSTFFFDITNFIQLGSENSIKVRVSNAEFDEVIPIRSDFPFYGGIYRDVFIETRNNVHFSHDDFGSDGIYFKEKEVTKAQGVFDFNALVKNQDNVSRNIDVKFRILDNSSLVLEMNKSQEVQAKMTANLTIPITISNPKLWNGRQDPFRYTVECILTVEGVEVQREIKKLGIRSFYVDHDNGFFLNNKSYKLHGVSRRQDRPEIGSAILKHHIEEDVKIMLELGTTAVRLSHHQHTQYYLDLLEDAGIVLWGELPFIAKYNPTPDFHQNAKNMLQELIMQNYNRPAICFWGLYNELEEGQNVHQFVKELHDLAKDIDPVRLTSCATLASNNAQINVQTDLTCWNNYAGWYGGEAGDMAGFLDALHAMNKTMKICITEYGAGASIRHQAEAIAKTAHHSYWHPENYQLQVHVEIWRILQKRTFAFATFLWNTFDFASPSRREGDRDGINDKGLVTFDRQIKKDAFYFYKANWNGGDVLRVANCRCVQRKNAKTEIVVISSGGVVKLSFNGVEVGVAEVDEVKLAKFDVVLVPGENVVRAEGGDGNMHEECVWWLD